jgi:hypothetical protein
MVTESIYRLRGLVKNGTATREDFKSVIVRARGLECDLASEAESLFRDGLTEEAHARLNLWTRPKWASEHECRKAYAAHMAAQRAARPSSGA